MRALSGKRCEKLETKQSKTRRPSPVSCSAEGQIKRARRSNFPVSAVAAVCTVKGSNDLLFKALKERRCSDLTVR